MNAPNPSSASPPSDDPQHLSRLQSLIERIMADGKISASEATELRAALIADGQVSPDEMELIRTVMKKYLGDGHLEFE